MSAPFDIAGFAQSAERILVPTSKDSLSGVRAFTELTGVEVPDSLWRDEYVESAGRSFRLVRPVDMPDQVNAGWGDMAISSTELVAEADVRSVIGLRYGQTVCRYSVLALEDVAADWQDFLEKSPRYPSIPRVLPASFPKFLGKIASARDLAITPAAVQISGKGEATMRASGVPAVADRVVTGTTAARLGAREVFTLANIYPELVVRRKDAAAYQPQAA